VNDIYVVASKELHWKCSEGVEFLTSHILVTRDAKSQSDDSKPLCPGSQYGKEFIWESLSTQDG
jgi:hypothetical protein